MTNRILKSDLLLLLTAAVWGFAFVAQRAGMDHVGPFIYNALRFAIGALTLLPIIIISNRKSRPLPNPDPSTSRFTLLRGGIFAGLILFAGATLQQTGLVYTTAGKAGFITGLYVVLVPIMALFWKQKVPIGTWIGVVLAAIGLYFLSITGTLSIAKGDTLVLIGSFVWAGHVLLIGRYSPKVDPIKLACMQFALCSVLSLIVSLFAETTTIENIRLAAIPILYGGFFSAGIGFTLQIIAQRDAPPTHASIIMSLETVFAAIGGWWILSEMMTSRMLFGCVLMLVGMLMSSFRMRPLSRPD